MTHFCIGLRATILVTVALAAAGSLATGVADAGPAAVQGRWMPGYWISDFESNPIAMVVFDDGTGPALYVGGLFRSASGVVVNGVARWNGAAWTPLTGPHDIGTDFYVAALAVYDDGTGSALYAGGGFVTAGGVVANHVAKWDGSAWSALTGPSGTGTQEWVGALATYDDGSGTALYVGGWFTTAGGVTANNIARWDGSTWSALTGPLGTGTSYRVNALVVHDDGDGPALYAGGAFTSAGGQPVNNVARWDGSTWTPLASASGAGTSGEVYDLEVYDDGSGPALFVGGQFTTAGGVTVNNIARWDGSSWSGLYGPSGTGTANSVRALTVFDDGSGAVLIAGGPIRNAGGQRIETIASWDGSTWSPLIGTSGSGLGSPTSSVRTVVVFDPGDGPKLVAGGGFVVIGDARANQIATWDGTDWAPLTAATGNGLNGHPKAMQVYDDGHGRALYVGGLFPDAGDQRVERIARWDGSAWSGLDGPSATGVSWPVVQALAVFDDGTGSALYVGGEFDEAGGIDVQNIARWNGSWSALPGTTLDNEIWTLEVFDDGNGPALYAGGEFVTAAGLPVNFVAYWRDGMWQALTGTLGTGTNGPVLAMVVHDDGSGPALYMGGAFTSAGGMTVNGIARWDGTTWSGLSGPSGIGVDSTVWALETFHDGATSSLYAGGHFDQAGGVTVNKIARWDGEEWSPLGPPANPGVGPGDVLSLKTHFDGFNSALYLGGYFTSAGGIPVDHLARWDGATFSRLQGIKGGGLDDQVDVLASYDDGTGPSLFAGGWLSTADGIVSTSIAEWDVVSVFADGFESGNTAAWSTTIP